MADSTESAPNMAEHALARRLAQHILDRPRGDPDDDLAILSRQLLRADEVIQDLRLRGGSVTAHRDTYQRRAEAVAPLLKQVLALETRSLHDGYDNGPGGGNFIYRDVILTDEAFPLIEQAIAKSEGR
jgi:hypothetical protein